MFLWIKEKRLRIEKDETFSSLYEAAMMLGLYDVLRILENVGFEGKGGSFVCRHLAAEGKVELLEWAVSSGFGCDGSVALAAVTNARPCVLQWLRDNNQLKHTRTGVVASSSYELHIV
jgi:hypothetical protein